MIEERRGSSGPPYVVLLAVAIGAILMVPALIGDGGEAVTEAISELLSPLGLLLDSSHMTGGTTIGGVLFLVLALVLLYSKISIFGGDSGE